MSLVLKLKPHLSELRKEISGTPVRQMTNTDRRLALMTAIILNKTLSQAEKDKRLKTLVQHAATEKRLSELGIKL